MAHPTGTIEGDPLVSSMAEETDAAQRQKPEPLKSDQIEPRRKSVPRWALGILGLIAAVALFSWWLHARRFESTDDAEIEGHLNAISSRITGTVLHINPSVENNQYVEAGTLLIELDPNDYQAALDHAKGDLADREGTARSASVNVPITGTSAFSRLRLAEAAFDEALAPNGTACDIRHWSRSGRSPGLTTMPVRQRRLQRLRRSRRTAPS
jgi:membrane fusion protein, multidrug efflux system